MIGEGLKCYDLIVIHKALFQWGWKDCWLIVFKAENNQIHYYIQNLE